MVYTTLKMNFIKDIFLKYGENTGVCNHKIANHVNYQRVRPNPDHFFQFNSVYFTQHHILVQRYIRRPNLFTYIQYSCKIQQSKWDGRTV